MLAGAVPGRDGIRDRGSAWAGSRGARGARLRTRSARPDSRGWAACSRRPVLRSRRANKSAATAGFGGVVEVWGGVRRALRVGWRGVRRQHTTKEMRGLAALGVRHSAATATSSSSDGGDVDGVGYRRQPGQAGRRSEEEQHRGITMRSDRVAKRKMEVNTRGPAPAAKQSPRQRLDPDPVEIGGCR